MAKYLLSALFLLVSLVGVGQIPEDGLIAYFPFNGNANDESSIGNNATVEGATLTTDRIGNINEAYLFDGQNDLIFAPDIPEYTFTNDYTISAWVNPSELRSQTIVRKGPVINGPNRAPYSLSITGINTVSSSLFLDEQVFGLQSQTGYEINFWQLITTTREGDIIKLYRNGQLIAQETVSGVMLDEEAPLHIGSRSQVVGDTFLGKIDEVRMYNRALSQSEINTIYFENLDPTLVAYYPFNGNANDESFYSNNGIVDGAQLTTDRFGIPNSAYEFDGLDDIIRVVDNPNLYFEDDFSFNVWVYPTAIKSQTILVKGPAVSGPNEAPFAVSVSAVEENVFKITTQTDENHLFSDVGYELNKWQMFTAIRDGETMRLYLNGVLLNELEILGELMDEEAPLHIGSRNQVVGNTFLGKIDDVRLYNRVLTQQEISSFAENIPSSTNIVRGTIRFDFENNSCDENDYSTTGVMVQAENEDKVFSTRVNQFGEYSFLLEDLGTYNLTVIPESLPEYYEITPAEVSTVFNSYGNTETVDFCLTATNVFNDLKVTLLPLNEARPGFDVNYKIVYENLGTTIMGGSVSLAFDNVRQTYLSSNPTENNIDGNSIMWQFENLLPFKSQSIFINFNTLEPPINEDGDILSFVAEVNPVEEEVTPEDNVYEFEQTIINSYDPNDKQVLQGEEIYEDEVDGYLDYLVRFQNTGSASAVNITVTDTLSDNLNWNTFRTLSSSHDYRVEILDGNAVSFIFEDIYLPPESSDPEGSNGHIAFQIKPNETLSIGDEVENTANIYFDFNPPIITNTVSTQVVEPLSVNEFSLETLITLHPNPVSSTLQIQTSNSLMFQQSTIYSVLGKQLITTSEKQINMEALSSGIYFVNVKTNKGSLTKKIVKQ
ncbi:DUF7619 domain-containing protein [Marixanthomonas spongiae]|uniref:LamG-like jellyroll fold domain-containing protein n=1 Tax=Marixanthomonas spongiae TaxID=2174845 RepID=A0A2U0HWS8_9FLAO|nr:LamG-like jellyroll fold domain-containing protein [Marixanthomonas spongiae]PVW13332.1 hypothetical protein DDV96_13270 [Marixanthomonas spongiae]